jgi:hypothetical protein
MLWLALAYLALLPSLTLSQQNLTFIEGFVSSLATLGFTEFGKTLLLINQTSEGQLVLDQLSSGGNFTVFVPSNEACESRRFRIRPLFLAPGHSLNYAVTLTWWRLIFSWMDYFYVPANSSVIMSTDRLLQSPPSTLPMRQRRAIQRPWRISSHIISCLGTFPSPTLPRRREATQRRMRHSSARSSPM